MGGCPQIPNPCGGGGGGGGCGKGGGDDYDRIQCIRKKAEERYQQLKKRCLAGLIAALLAGGLVSSHYIFLCSYNQSISSLDCMANRQF